MAATMDCPACRRPNALTRRLCLYCGTALPSGEADRLRVSTLVPSRERRREGLVVAILPGESTPERVEAAAKALGCDPFAAQQIFRRPVPTFYSFASELEAAAFEGLLDRAGAPYVHFDYRALDSIDEASAVAKVELSDDDTMELWDAEALLLRGPLSEVRYVATSRIEVERVKEIRTVQFALDDELPERNDKIEKKHEYDAFTVIDLYGDFARGPARLVEGVATIDGAGFRRACRGGAFTRFVPWLRERLPELPVDDHHRAMGGAPRRVERERGGKTDTLGVVSHREVTGIEITYSGQNWDEYSARSYLVYQLTQKKSH